MSLTLTRSRNREDMETLLLLLTLKVLLASKEGLCMWWLGFQGPVGEGRPPTSRLMSAILSGFPSVWSFRRMRIGLFFRPCDDDNGGCLLRGALLCGLMLTRWVFIAGMESGVLGL